MERFFVVAEVGAVGGITIVVGTALQGSSEYFIRLLDTADGWTDVGGSFVGAGAERNAILFAESVQIALSSAFTTWVLGGEVRSNG